MRYAPFLAVLLWTACATTPEASGESDPVECLAEELRRTNYVITLAASDRGLVIAESRMHFGPGARPVAVWVLTFRIRDDGAIETSVEEGSRMAESPSYESRRSREEFAATLARRCSGEG